MYFDFWEWELQGIPSKRGTLGSDHFPANRNIAIHFQPWGCVRALTPPAGGVGICFAQKFPGL